MLGHDSVGSGLHRVVVLNDWLCDTSTWESARPYLDRGAFTWVFADLRGYGRSRGQAGAHTVAEAADDVIALADALGFARFTIVGHSMSTLVALHLAQQHPDRVDRAVILTPPPPAGFGADAATIDAMQALARGDDERRVRGVRTLLGDRLSEGWIRFKAERWRASSDPEAVAAYVAMFARDGLPDRAARVACPVLAITGEQDGEIMRSAAVSALLAPLCERLVLVALGQCGHYPMQECPPLLVQSVERFLAAGATEGGPTLAPP
jgi:pimeloyl-ACP methyl ester carboxylesterase